MNRPHIPFLPPQFAIRRATSRTLIGYEKRRSLANRTIGLINADRRCENLFLTTSRG